MRGVVTSTRLPFSDHFNFSKKMLPAIFKIFFCGFFVLVASTDRSFSFDVHIQEISYEEIEVFATTVVSFEAYADQNIDKLFQLDGMEIGERFSGQTIKIKQDNELIAHDVLDKDSVAVPLRIEAGERGHNLGVYWDENLSSYALMPHGPTGAITKKDFGTGSLAILFSEPICFFAFKINLDGLYRDRNISLNTVNRQYEESALNIKFYDSSGAEMANFRRFFAEGPTALGYMQSGSADPQIKGIFIQSLDLSGIGLDDLRFDPTCPQRLF